MPLHVYRFAVVDTIEERITEILEEKQRVFDSYIEGVPAEPPSLTDADLTRILSLYNRSEEETWPV